MIAKAKFYISLIQTWFFIVMLVLGPYGMPSKKEHNPLDVAYDNERRKLVLLRYLRASSASDYQIAGILVRDDSQRSCIIEQNNLQTNSSLSC